MGMGRWDDLGERERLPAVRARQDRNQAALHGRARLSTREYLSRPVSAEAALEAGGVRDRQRADSRGAARGRSLARSDLRAPHASALNELSDLQNLQFAICNYRASTAMAMPMPPPMHNDATP